MRFRLVNGRTVVAGALYPGMFGRTSLNDEMAEQLRAEIAHRRDGTGDGLRV